MLHNNVLKRTDGINFVITAENERNEGATYVSACRALQNIRECIDRNTLRGYYDGLYGIEYAVE